MNIFTIISACMDLAASIGRKVLSGTSKFCALVVLCSAPVCALQTRPASLCDAAAQVAAQETGVPINVLRAITLTETGRKIGGQFGPWPWTVNMEGTGHWFATPVEAQDFVDKNVILGLRSFDVGCFQLNHRWHGQAFASIEQMFDPVQNARYAAVFLKKLYKETEDWSLAAGAYHSRTPKFAKKYRARFDKLRAELNSAQPPKPIARPTITAVHKPRVNAFPLLKPPATPGRLGSLVSVGSHSTATRLIAWE